MTNTYYDAQIMEAGGVIVGDRIVVAENGISGNATVFARKLALLVAAKTMRDCSYSACSQPMFDHAVRLQAEAEELK